MTAAEPSFDQNDCWTLEALPGDGLVATSGHHLLIVEVDDDIASSGVADEIVATFDAHCQLLGRGAARSLQLAISAILAERQTPPCAVALVSTWDDELAVYLHGRADAVLRGSGAETRLSGRSALVATDVVLAHEFEELELHVGERPEDDRVAVEVGEVVAGRGVRLQLQRPSSGPHPLNTWAAAT